MKNQSELNPIGHQFDTYNYEDVDENYHSGEESMIKKLNMIKIISEQSSARPSVGAKLINNLGYKVSPTPHLQDISPVKRMDRIDEFDVNNR